MLKDVLKIKANNDDETVEQLRRADQPVFVYGAGVMARMLYEQFLERGFGDIKLVVDDRKKAVVDPIFSGWEIKESRDLDAAYPEYIIVIGFYEALFDVDKFTRQFKNASAVKTYLNIFYALEKMTPEYFEEHYDGFESVYQMLADDESRVCMEAYLKAKISHDYSYLQPHLSSGLQYFSDDFLKLTDHESYVDCGAYDGNSIRDFLEAVGGRYTHIWALEPDPANYKLMSSFIAGRSLREVTLLEVGASSEKMRLPFVMGEGQGSRVAEGGEAFVDCDIIDDITEGREVTFIKMDIEGSELAALKGATKAIKKYRPNIAASAYHRADDFLTLPAFLRQLAPEYKFYVRLYNLLWVDAVLFAIAR